MLSLQYLFGERISVQLLKRQAAHFSDHPLIQDLSILECYGEV